MADPQEPPQDDDGAATPDLRRAYSELAKRLGNEVLDASALSRASEGFRRASGIDETMKELRDKFHDQIASAQLSVPQIDPIDIQPIAQDTRPAEIAANTERMAELTAQQNTAIAQLVELTINSLALSQAQQEQAKSTDKFTRRMTWISVILTLATVGVSSAALIVALTTTG